MNKLLSSISILCLSTSFVYAVDHGVPPEMCPADCTGANAVTPTDFSKKSNGKDPINGGALGATIKVAIEEGQSQTENVPSHEFLNQLNEFEKYTASQCGQSLENDTKEVVVAKACSNNLLNRTALKLKNMHSPTGNPLPPLGILNKFFDAASSPAAQENLKTQVYKANDGMGITSQKCKEAIADVGGADTVQLLLSTKMCRALFIPQIAPKLFTIGLPKGTTTSLVSSYSLDSKIFGINVPILGVKSFVSSPLDSTPLAKSTFSRMGVNVDGFSLNAEKISQDKLYKLADFEYAQEMTMPIGPLEITIELGAHGTLDVASVTRATRMWANVDSIVHPKLDAWMSASVGFWIARAGAEGKLKVVDETLHNYGFTGIAAVPVSGTNTMNFVFSEQLTNYDDFRALAGNFNLFAKVRVPKFFGMKWKKYSKNIFSWEGIHTVGYLWSLQRNAVPTNKLYNSYLNGDDVNP